MGDRVKSTIGCVIPVVVVVGLFVWGHYREAEKRETRERERTTEAEEREAEERRVTAEYEAERVRREESDNQTFKDLAERHNAALDWSDVHDNGGFYTLELQDALQKHGDRAVFVCCIGDVFKLGDGFRVFSPYVYEGQSAYVDENWWAREVTLLLDVDETTARHLVEVHEYEPGGEEATYFAVAVDVKRVTVTLRREYDAVGEFVEAGTYEFGQDTEAYIEEGGLRPKILITGKCLEIVPLENYYGM